MTERRYLIAQRYLKGEMQSQIARTLGVTQQQISLDLKVIHRWWRESAIRDFDAAQAQELAKIDLLEQTAWEAWQRSIQPREITLTEQTEGGETYDAQGNPRPKPPTRKASMRKEGQVGDPRFLEQVYKCIERRCALLGLNAPQKVAPTSPDGKEPWEGRVILLPSKAPTENEWMQQALQFRGRSPGGAEA